MQSTTENLTFQFKQDNSTVKTKLSAKTHKNHNDDDDNNDDDDDQS